MSDGTPVSGQDSKSARARRRRRAIRDSKRNMRTLHREMVEDRARPSVRGHPVGCQCEACERVRNPQYWVEREAWQAAHPGEDWYLRDRADVD